eukprot:TRINITY_DN66535_c0_g1_i1.p1 TRINITY_DN66535_c0_g1~~TRINITY_DN66535_c0_g1_i1.p1  ORF type:complete len:563 (+),score=105.92 TRINITY_DN66535_c0_g1_i1:116-1804(+)
MRAKMCEIKRLQMLLLFWLFAAVEGQMTSTSMSLSPTAYVTGTTPTEMVFTMFTGSSGALAATETITIAADQAIWSAAASTTCSVVKGDQADTTTFTFATTDTQTLVATVASGKSVPILTKLVFTCTDNFAAHGAAATVVAFTYTSTTDSSVSVTGYTVGKMGVILDPSNALTSVTPTSVTFFFTTTNGLAAGHVITIEASGGTVFLSAVATTCAVEIGGSSDTTTFASGIAATSQYILEATVATGESVAMNTQVKLVCTDNLGALAAAGTTVQFRMKSTTDTSWVTGITGWTTTAPAAGNDPFTRFNDIVQEFELPPQVLTNLVESEDLVIQGSVFEGGGSYEQWFDRIVLKTTAWGSQTAQDRWIDVKVKKNLHEVNMSKVPKNEHFTLDITMGFGQVSNPDLVTKLPPDVHIPYDFMGYETFVRKMQRWITQMPVIGKFPRECVNVAGWSVHLYICSAPAPEYYGPLRHLSLKYAHLDLVFLQVRDYNSLSGLLPELWGLQPMSEFTKSTIKKRAPRASQEDAQNLSSKAAWADIGLEGMQKACSECSQLNSSGAAATF